MMAFRGARIVTGTRIVEGGTLLVDGSRVVDVVPQPRRADETVDLHGRWILPGFIDVHVHGIEGHDVLDEGWPVQSIADRLPRYGVTAFCPTTVACSPGELAGVLAAVAAAQSGSPRGARVLPAHLESNFISPAFKGAQPLTCLRRPPSAPAVPEDADLAFSGAEILSVIDTHGHTGIVTLAAELPGALDLIRTLTGRGIRVSQGHSGATYDEAMAGYDQGARHATHLFNRMSPLHHRDPGLVGATLERDDVLAELVCDGYHVHPAAAQIALRLKSPARIIAITDGTGGSGLAVGAKARLGGRTITVGERAAFLDDGTLAGSTLTMDLAFRMAIQRFGCSVLDAARMCAANPARALRLTDQGTLEPGTLADFVVLDEEWRPLETWVHGACAWTASRNGTRTVPV